MPPERSPQRPGPASHPGLPGLPARPGGFAGGGYPAGPRPGPWGPPGGRVGPSAATDLSGPFAAQPPLEHGAGVAPAAGTGPAEGSSPEEPTTDTGRTDAPAETPAAAAETVTHGTGVQETGVQETGVQETGALETGTQDSAEAQAADTTDTPDAASSGAPEETPAARPSRLSLRPLSQRRQAEAGALLRPGSAPRLRPRPAQEADEAEAAVAGTPQSASGDELFASAEEGDAASPTTASAPAAAAAPDPDGIAHGTASNGFDRYGADPDGADRDGAGQLGAGYPNGAGHTNGAGQANGARDTNGAAHTNGSGLPVRGRSGPETAPRRPAAVLNNRERTPIFDEVASVWFREPEPNAPTAVDPEWDAADRPDFEAGAPSLAAVDAGTTEAGLPRRRPRAHLVPGSARPGPPSGRTGENGAAVPRRSPDAVRGRLASYQRGVADGRSNRPVQRPDGDTAGGIPNRGPAHAAGPHTEEEEQ
jgi:hypothetical protein